MDFDIMLDSDTLAYQRVRGRQHGNAYCPNRQREHSLKRLYDRWRVGLAAIR